MMRDDSTDDPLVINEPRPMPEAGHSPIGSSTDRPDSGYGSEHRRTSPVRDWRLKAAIQTIFSRVPGGERLNYELQRRVTKTLPISDVELAAQVGKAQRHLGRFERHSDVDVAQAHLYEFGVGWDLIMPLAYYSMGVERQTVLDIRPLARVDLIVDAATRMAARADELGLSRSPRIDGNASSVAALVSRWGIEYRAPADARRVELPDGSVDLVTSTDVFEHVPLNDIRPLLMECRRLLRPEGVLSLRVDYQDHYWYFDARVDAFHFLRYSAAKWKRFNPGLHYQNRIRHAHFVDIIKNCGFVVVESDVAVPTREDLERIADTPLAPAFRAMAPEELAVRYANLTLRPRTEQSAR
jgi:SAM-dependent methyltransferase